MPCTETTTGSKQQHLNLSKMQRPQRKGVKCWWESKCSNLCWTEQWRKILTEVNGDQHLSNLLLSQVKQQFQQEREQFYCCCFQQNTSKWLINGLNYKNTRPVWERLETGTNTERGCCESGTNNNNNKECLLWRQEGATLSSLQLENRLFKFNVLKSTLHSAQWCNVYVWVCDKKTDENPRLKDFLHKWTYLQKLLFSFCTDYFNLKSHKSIKRYTRSIYCWKNTPRNQSVDKNDGFSLTILNS